jgi:hypothetical protein
MRFSLRYFRWTVLVGAGPGRRLDLERGRLRRLGRCCSRRVGPPRPGLEHRHASDLTELDWSRFGRGNRRGSGSTFGSFPGRLNWTRRRSGCLKREGYSRSEQARRRGT